MDGNGALEGASSVGVAEYRAGVAAEVGRAAAALDAAFADLRLQRRARLARTAAQSREQFEKAAHAEQLARAEAARRTQLDAERRDRERWQRQKEADDARKRDEERRQQHIEEAARAQKAEAERQARIVEARQSADAAQTRAAAAAAAQQTAKQAPATGSLFGRPSGSGAAQAAAPSAAPSTAPPKPALSATRSATPSATPSAAPQLGTDWKKVDAEFQAAQDRIAWIRENVKMQLKQQPKDVQDRVRELQGDLRARFGMLTDSKRKLIEVREVVRAHFAEMRQSGNPVAYMAVLNAFAKLLVSQGEAEAQKTVERALPLAMLTVLLWDEFRELGDYVVPRFVKKCPQVIGYSCPITTEEGRRRMGWKREGAGGRYESEERYAERIAGICSVWSTMTQSKMSTSKQTVHPYPISHSWIFLARHLNRPKAEVTAADYAAVGAWWDMTATRFLDAFGEQARKLLTAVWETWTEDRMEFPALRLRGLGEDWQATGKLEHAWKPLAP